jgi:hypothetical protein
MVRAAFCRQPLYWPRFVSATRWVHQIEVDETGRGEPMRQARAEMIARNPRCLSIGWDLERNGGQRLDPSEMPVDAEVNRGHHAWGPAAT